MANQRNDADSIVRQALTSINDNNLSPNIFNFNFNTYNNCYNSNPNVSESESEKDEEFTAEIEISNNQEPVQGPRQTTGVRTTTRSAVVPISSGSSTKISATEFKKL